MGQLSAEDIETLVQHIRFVASSGAPSYELPIEYASTVASTLEGWTERRVGATEPYVDAVADGTGPLAAEWRDQPRNLVLDLAHEIDRLRNALASVENSARSANEWSSFKSTKEPS